MKLTSLTVSAFTAGAMISTSFTAGAALIAYEGFDYPSNSAVVGQNGGTGWNGEWVAHNADSPGLVVNGTGLSYPNFPSTGLSVTPGGYVSARRSFSSSNLTEGVLYMSMLIQPLSNTRTGIRISNNSVGQNSSTFQAAFGIFDGVAAIVDSFGNNTKLAQSSAVTTGVTHLLVARIDLTTDTIRLYLDPTPGGAEPTTASTSYTWSTDRLNNIGSITAGGLSGGNGGQYDEIRVGTTFAAVAVPEPSSVGLLALGAGLLARRRRS